MERKAALYKLFFFLLGFLLYAKTVNYEFTLDDKLYVTQNDFVKQGWKGLNKVWSTDLMEGYKQGQQSDLLTGGRYRPLALTLHIIEEELHGSNPFWSHFLNALLYGLLSLLAFIFFSRMYSVSSSPVIREWGVLAATLIYLLHPLHVEAVANVRNRDEMLSSLLGLGSFVFLFSYLKENKGSGLVIGSLLLLSAYLTKESSINFLVVLGLSFLFLYGSFQPARSRTVTAVIAVFVTTLTFFVLRHWATATPSETEVAAELLNNVYLNASPTERIAGILFIYGMSIRLLWFPYPLTHDYYPYHPFRTYEELAAGLPPYPQLSDVEVIISIVSLILLLGLLIWSLIKASRSFVFRLLAFCIALFFASTLLYSNIFFEIGSFFNERFLFIASLGMALLAGYIISWVVNKQKAAGLALLALTSIGYAMISWNRISDWEHDETLVLQDVRTSTASARANLIAAEASLNFHKEKAEVKSKWLESRFNDYLEQGESYATRALTIYPEYTAPLDILGNIYYEQGRVEESFKSFLRFYRRKPEDRIKNNFFFLAKDQLNKENPEVAASFYKLMSKVLISPLDRAEAYSSLGNIYGRQFNQADSSIYFIQNAIALDNSRGEFYENLGVAYAVSGQLTKARQNFLKALESGVENRQILINIGLTYQQAGDLATAQSYFQRAEALENK